MLRNALPVALREEVAPARGVSRALSMVVLALLYLEGGKMEESEFDVPCLSFRDEGMTPLIRAPEESVAAGALFF